MAKVITFSRFFPSYHPRKGEPTYFVEKIWSGLGISWFTSLEDKLQNLNLNGFSTLNPKYHTIRAGHRFKVGDWFSPRVWSGKPYRSKQIIIAPDIQVKKTWDFKFIHGSPFSEHDVMALVNDLVSPICEISKNDGLNEDDFMDWFNNDFDGQIICWKENINY